MAYTWRQGGAIYLTGIPSNTLIVLYRCQPSVQHGSLGGGGWCCRGIADAGVGQRLAVAAILFGLIVGLLLLGVSNGRTHLRACAEAREQWLSSRMGMTARVRGGAAAAEGTAARLWVVGWSKAAAADL